MNLITFRDWIMAKEASSSTRARGEAARGLKPVSAGFMSRSTPPPWEFEKLKDKLKDSQKCRKKKR